MNKEKGNGAGLEVSFCTTGDQGSADRQTERDRERERLSARGSPFLPQAEMTHALMQRLSGKRLGRRVLQMKDW